MINVICRRCFLRHCKSYFGRNSLYANYRHQKSFHTALSSHPLFGILVNTQFKIPSNQSNVTYAFNTRTRWFSVNVGASNSNDEDAENFYSVHYVFVQTSVDRWHESPEGLEFDVGFADSMPLNNSNVPVIVGLPCSLGSHKDLMKVLLVFVKYGCRVIIPNMPGSKFSMCRSRSEATIFTNSVDEKQEYVADFLTELGVKKVDMLVTDSDSVYTGISLCSQRSDIFKSFAMINPTGLEYTKYMSPVLLFKNINRMWDEVFYMQPICWLFICLFKIFTSKRQLSTNELITFSKTVSNLNFKEVSTEIKGVRDIGTPLLALHGEESKHMKYQSTQDILERLGIPQSSVTVYNKHGEIVTKGMKDESNKGFMFEGVTQDLLETRSKIIRTKLFEFYKSVKTVKHR